MIKHISIESGEEQTEGLTGVCIVPCMPYNGSDPIEAWIELMEVVEALCPRWPARRPRVGKDYRL